MYFEKIETVEQALKVAERAKAEGLLGLYPKALQVLAEHFETTKSQEELFFVGYTNGAQVLYASEDEGSMYSNTESDCHIPLYMLKTHEHRLQAKLTEGLDFETVLKVRAASSK